MTLESPPGGVHERELVAAPPRPGHLRRASEMVNPTGWGWRVRLRSTSRGRRSSKHCRCRMRTRRCRRHVAGAFGRNRLGQRVAVLELRMVLQLRPRGFGVDRVVQIAADAVEVAAELLERLAPLLGDVGQVLAEQAAARSRPRNSISLGPRAPMKASGKVMAAAGMGVLGSALATRRQPRDRAITGRRGACLRSSRWARSCLRP